MAQPKLIYFSVRARGELPRLIAAAGGIQIEDRRLSMEEWMGPEYKPKTPFGQIPVLVLGDQSYGQKLAISLYLAKKAGLYPKSGDELECLKIDSYLLYTLEILDNILEGVRHQKMQNNPATLEKVKAETLPQKIPRLEAILKQNGTGFFIGNKLSIVDLSAFDVIDHVVQLMGQSFLDSFPLLKANFKRVGEIPGVKNYVANRPKQVEGMELF